MIGNLNYYHVFYTVAKTGSISKAAAQLFISQPAVSKAIANLEHETGTELFVRTSRGVTLTEEGALLSDYIGHALDTISKGEENLKRYNELGVGHLRIGASTSLCKHILLGYLKPFIKEHPHIKVSIDCHSTLHTIRLLQKEEIDIGLICETELPSGMVYTPVQSIHDIFVASSDYIDNSSVREQDTSLHEIYGADRSGQAEQPYETIRSSTPIMGNIAAFLSTETHEKQTPACSEDVMRRLFSHSTLMALEEANITRTHVDAYLQKHAFSCSQLLEINNMDLLLDFAAIGLGIASVVREFSESYLTDGRIVELPLSEPIPERTVGFAFLQSRRRTKAFSSFLESCQLEA